MYGSRRPLSVIRLTDDRVAAWMSSSPGYHHPASATITSGATVSDTLTVITTPAPSGSR